MNNIWSAISARAALIALALLPALGHAAPQPPVSVKEIPAALKPWEAWATWGEEHRLCPTPYSDAAKHLCFWPSRLNLQAAGGGGKFDLTVTVFHETWVPLPGNADVWPLDVRANGAPVAVLEREGNPAVRLFALFGADWVRGDWLTAWTLLDLFLLLIFSLAVFRLWGFWASLLAFLAFGLSYHEPGAPRYLWLILLIPLALQRVVPEGWGRRLLSVGKWVAVTAFVLVLVPFVVVGIKDCGGSRHRRTGAVNCRYRPLPLAWL